MYGDFGEDDVGADYRHLLRRGSVMRRLAPSKHADWRKAIRAQARADDLAVRTWSRAGPPGEVWAVLPAWSLTSDEHERLQRRLAWLRED